MPTYITLLDYTQQGIGAIEDSPDRLDDAKDLAASLGGELTEFYLTFGRYDAVVVSEFPDDESYAQFALQSGKQGAVSTETLKAFTEGEYRDIIAALAPEEAGPGGHTA